MRESMQSRSDSLSKEITSAETRFNDAEAELALYQGKLEALEKDAETLLAEYRELGERERDRIREQAQKDADRILREYRPYPGEVLQEDSLGAEDDEVGERQDETIERSMIHSIAHSIDPSVDRYVDVLIVQSIDRLIIQLINKSKFQIDSPK